MQILQSIFSYVLHSVAMTLSLILTLFLPIIVCLIILRILSTMQEKRLWDIGGYGAVLFVAWLGTPVHELSHLIAAIIFRHKIKEVKLFRPNPETGTLGYITHSYAPKSIYQAFLGNTVIALAPFFGGSLALYTMIRLLLPRFSLYDPNVPVIQHLTFENMLSLKSYSDYLKTTWLFFSFLKSQMLSGNLLHNWQFYVFVYLVLCISIYLSPSEEDFKLFWKPLLLFLGVLILIFMATGPFFDLRLWLIKNCAKPILQITPLLYLALFLNCFGFVLIHSFWVIKKMLSHGR